jgi:isopropylmalate/citramalate/homocitrate synthase-like protein
MGEPEKMKERVYVFDTTLRDGEQTPGVSLTPEEKLQIARQLDRLGVDVIEAGFPITSEGEFQAIKRIVKEGLNSKICALARTAKTDMDRALDTGAERIHVFIATSDIHLKHKLKMTREEVYNRAVESVEYLKSHGVEVEFSAEDATRSDIEFLKQIYAGVVKAGADYLDVPDTVGMSYPEKMKELVKEIKRVSDGAVVGVHCHNDFGLAVANTIAGIVAGARQFHATINGIGERAGNASLEEAVMALKTLYGYELNIRTELIYETSRLVSRLTGIYIPPNKAIVGDNAFGHESGIHTHGVLSEPSTYEPIKPEVVGKRRWFVAGKHAGTHGIKAQLESYGISPSQEQLKLIVSMVKELGDKGKTVTDADLIAIANSVMGQIREEERAVSLDEFVVVTGYKVIPTASVRISLGGNSYSVAQLGVGPVDAAMKAIQEVLKDTVKVRLKEYRLEAITGGSDALAEVSVRVEDSEGLQASARVAGPDIVQASVEAMIEGINKLLLKKKILKKDTR